MLSYFLLQCSDKKTISKASALYANLQLIEQPAGFAGAIKKTQNEHDVEADWFAPLVEAIAPYFHKDDGQRYFNNPMHDFLSDIFERQFVDDILDGSFVSSLSGFSEAELSAPHFRWVRLLDSRSKQCHQVPHTVYPALLARIHPLDGIADGTANTLIDMYCSKYICGMQFNDFLRWYLRSRELFAVENQALKPEIMTEMVSRIKNNVALGVSADVSLRMLKKRYGVSPYHLAFVEQMSVAFYDSIL